MQKAARLMNEQKATVIVEHIAYDPTGDMYTMDIFTQDKPKEDFSKAVKADHHIYDYVFTDSKNERNFVRELDASTEVVVYAKLPRGFFIPTRLATTTPTGPLRSRKARSGTSTLSPRPRVLCPAWICGK
jgi:type III restriction enzyme